MREAVAVLVRWLGDTTNGVGALLAAVPVTAGDDQPELSGGILSEYVDDIAAVRRLEQDGDTWIAVYGSAVRWEEDKPIGSGSQLRYGEVDLLVRGDLRAQPAEGQRQMDYLLTAVERSVRRLRKTEAPDRTEDGVTLLYPTAMERGRGDAPIEDNIVTAGVTITWRFADTVSEGL